MAISTVSISAVGSRISQSPGRVAKTWLNHACSPADRALRLSISAGTSMIAVSTRPTAIAYPDSNNSRRRTSTVENLRFQDSKLG